MAPDSRVFQKGSTYLFMSSIPSCTSYLNAHGNRGKSEPKATLRSVASCGMIRKSFSKLASREKFLLLFSKDLYTSMLQNILSLRFLCQFLFVEELINHIRKNRLYRRLRKFMMEERDFVQLIETDSIVPTGCFHTCQRIPLKTLFSFARLRFSFSNHLQNWTRLRVFQFY